MPSPSLPCRNHFEDLPPKKKYTIIRKIGSGAFGSVFEAKDRQIDAMVAIKIQGSSRESLNELRICNMIAAVESKLANRLAFTHEFFRISNSQLPNVCCAMELLGPSLEQTIRHGGAFSIEFASQILLNIMLGLLHLHDKVNVAHFDLSMANVVFVERCHSNGHFRRPQLPNVRLIDFNSAQPFSEFKPGTFFVLNYRAPEIILKLKPTQSADVWALGCIAYALVIGSHLFHQHNEIETLIDQVDRIGPMLRQHLETAFHKGCKLVYWDERTGEVHIDRGTPAYGYEPGNAKPLEPIIAMDQNYHDMVVQMLEMDYEKRVNVFRLLSCPVFNNSIGSSLHGMPDPSNQHRQDRIRWNEKVAKGTPRFVLHDVTLQHHDIYEGVDDSAPMVDDPMKIRDLSPPRVDQGLGRLDSKDPLQPKAAPIDFSNAFFDYANVPSSSTSIDTFSVDSANTVSNDRITTAAATATANGAPLPPIQTIYNDQEFNSFYGIA